MVRKIIRICPKELVGVKGGNGCRVMGPAHMLILIDAENVWFSSRSSLVFRSMLMRMFIHPGGKEKKKEKKWQSRFIVIVSSCLDLQCDVSSPKCSIQWPKTTWVNSALCTLHSGTLYSVCVGDENPNSV